MNTKDKIKIFAETKMADGTINIKEIETDEDIEMLEKEYEADQRARHQKVRLDLQIQNNRMTAHPMYCVMESIKLSDMKAASTGECVIERIQEIFFTNSEAEHYIVECQCEHKGNLYIYIKSGYRNDGWKLARELMRGDKSDK